jgi:hypothetical protein
MLLKDLSLSEDLGIEIYVFSHCDQIVFLFKSRAIDVYNCTFLEQIFTMQTQKKPVNFIYQYVN